MTRLVRTTCITTAIIFAAFASEARVFKQKTVRLVLNHSDGIVEAQNLGRVALDRSSLTAAEPLEVRMAQNVDLVIVDPNPVLFKYEWVREDTTPNTNYVALLSLAKSLGTLQGLISPGGGEELAALDEQREAVDDHATTLERYVEQMPDIARQSILNVSGAKAAVNAWKLESIEEDTKEFYEQLEEAEAEQDRQERRPRSVQPKESSSGATGTNESGRAGFQTEKDPSKKDSSAAPAGRLSERQIRRAFQQKEKIEEILTKLQTFRDQVRKINVEQTIKSVPYDAGNDKVQVIKITPNPDFAEIAAESGRATGELKFPIVPYYPAVAAFGAAPIYSFVDQPEYSKEKQEDGTYKIAETDKDYVGMNVSAMLTLTPRAWAESPLTGGFQLGISPVKDQIGIFTGIEFRFLEIAGIGIGYAYQQVKILAGGQTVGGPIGVDEELKTEPEYRGGLYFGLKLNLPEN